MTGKYKHRVIIINRAALHPADEEVVLVHIYLDAGRSSVEILEGLRTMLQQGANIEDKMETEECTLVRASSLGHLYDRRDRTSSGSPSQTFHSICQLPPGSEWVIGHRAVVPRWWSSYLLSVGEINFLCDNHEPSQNDSNLTAAFLPFLLQRVESRNLIPRELVVAVDKIVRGLCPFAVLVDGFKLLA